MKTSLLIKKAALIFCFIIGPISYSQVGIGTSSPIDGSMLDVSSLDKGVMIPRMDITDLTTLAPVTKLPASPEPIGLLVFNTDASNSGANAGFYYWDGNDWISVGGGASSNNWALTGNTAVNGGNTTTAGTNFIGTTDSQNLDFRTDDSYRGRINSAGQLLMGDFLSIYGSLVYSKGNAAFPLAIHGSTDLDAPGIYGSIESGATGFAAVQGEYAGTSMYGNGVRGITFTSTPGTDFTGNTVAGVLGTLGTGDLARSFGVYGDTGNNINRRTGGVIGTDLLAIGSLGYYANNGTSYSVYGFSRNFQTGGAGGRPSSETTSFDSHIGLGIYGGFMGGWIKGSEYGAMFSGDRFGSYTHGKTFTTDTYVVLDEKSNGEKVPTFANTSMTIDVQSKGIGQLNNGQSRIAFDKSFSELIDSGKPIIVTITPFGESNGVHLLSVDRNGFTIKENSNGTSNVQFNWIAIAEKSNKNTKISNELLTKEFEENSKLLMHNDDVDGGKAIWFENGEIRYGNTAPINPAKVENSKVNLNKSYKSTTKD